MSLNLEKVEILYRIDKYKNLIIWKKFINFTH